VLSVQNWYLWLCAIMSAPPPYSAVDGDDTSKYPPQPQAPYQAYPTQPAYPQPYPQQPVAAQPGMYRLYHIGLTSIGFQSTRSYPIPTRMAYQVPISQLGLSSVNVGYLLGLNVKEKIVNLTHVYYESYGKIVHINHAQCENVQNKSTIFIDVYKANRDRLRLWSWPVNSTEALSLLSTTTCIVGIAYWGLRDASTRQTTKRVNWKKNIQQFSWSEALAVLSPRTLKHS